MDVNLIIAFAQMPFSFGVSWYLLVKIGAALEKNNILLEKLSGKIDDCPVKER